MPVTIDDTYAEAFRSIYAEVLITARDRKWLDHAVAKATGHASSTIMCDCEAGLDRYVGLASGGCQPPELARVQIDERSRGANAPRSPEAIDTPDGRPGAVVQFHVPRFHKDRVHKLYRALLARISQNVLTCPTARAFSLQTCDEPIPLGRKIAYFGDGYETKEERFGRPVWVIPTMGGEFILDREFGYADGIMGGNLWFMSESEDAGIAAGEAAVEACSRVPGVICPFPGGLANSASKAGSKYKFLFASTYAEYCPTLKEKLGEKSLVPDGVNSISEIIINGRDLETVRKATYAAIDAAVNVPGLVRISAGNYGGRLGKSFIYLTQRS